MNIQAQKLELLEWLATLKDKKIIQELMQWKENHERVNIDQYNKEIEQADAEIDRGEYVTHEAAIKEIRSWREEYSTHLCRLFKD